MMYRFDRQTLDELRAVRNEAVRLGADPDSASYFGLSLDQYRLWIATGEKPGGCCDGE
jgi:hypothetical protein